MVEFCNCSWVGHRSQQLEGIPGGFGVQKNKRERKEKPSEARCTLRSDVANGDHKDLTALWHAIGCWTCGFLSGVPLPRQGGNEKEKVIASQESGISV